MLNFAGTVNFRPIESDADFNVGTHSDESFASGGSGSVLRARGPSLKKVRRFRTDVNDDDGYGPRRRGWFGKTKSLVVKNSIEIEKKSRFIE